MIATGISLAQSRLCAQLIMIFKSAFPKNPAWAGRPTAGHFKLPGSWAGRCQW